MKLELKKIKYCKWMSEETHCYDAVVYVDGKATIEVSNDGHGGADTQWAIKPFTDQDIEKVETWCKKNLPKWYSSFDKSQNDKDLEYWCWDEINKYLDKKHYQKNLNRYLKKSILYIKDNVIKQISFKGVSKIEKRHIDRVLKENPNLDLLNLMPKEKALEVYTQHIK